MFFPSTETIDEKMGIELLDINDDCLFDIFTYLNVVELAAVASTCNRFRDTAREVFLLRHKSKCLEIIVEAPDQRFPADIQHCARDHRQNTAIFRHFGDLINLKVTFFYHSELRYCSSVFNTMVKYCTRRLELINCGGLDFSRTTDTKGPFQNLKELVWYDSRAPNHIFLSNVDELTQLTIKWKNSTMVSEFLSNNYPKLQSLTLEMSPNLYLNLEEQRIDINGFLKRHPNLIELQLSEGGKYDLSSIGECCPLLEEIAIWKCFVVGFTFTSIAELEKLTSIKVSDVAPSMAMEFLKSSKSSESLEHLVLYGSCLGLQTELLKHLQRFNNLIHLSVTSLRDIDNDFLAGLWHLKQLRVLAIGYYYPCSFTSAGLVNLVQHLPLLEQLNLNPVLFCQYLRLCNSTYWQISQICQGRNQKLVIRNWDINSAVGIRDGDEDIVFQEPFFDESQPHQDCVRFIFRTTFNPRFPKTYIIYI